jgi:hypothetical protein
VRRDAVLALLQDHGRPLQDGATTRSSTSCCSTTTTDAALAFDCTLKISPRQLLTAESALGKALIAKYGMFVQKNDPVKDDPLGGGELFWLNSALGYQGPMIDASCSSEFEPLTGVPSEHQCRIHLVDQGIRKMEEAKQADRDQEKMKANQPKTAPSL